MSTHPGLIVAIDAVSVSGTSTSVRSQMTYASRSVLARFTASPRETSLATDCTSTSRDALKRWTKPSKAILVSIVSEGLCTSFVTIKAGRADLSSAEDFADGTGVGFGAGDSSRFGPRPNWAMVHGATTVMMNRTAAAIDA